MSGRLIRVLVVAFSGLLPLGAVGQGLEVGAVASAPAPRLIFSEKEMALARAVARAPGLADFYGSNGLRTVFSGPEAAGHRLALIAAVSRAGQHGLPPARYQIAALRQLHASGVVRPEDELLYARVFARWTHDVGGGMLDPRKIDPTIKREILRPDTADLLREFAHSVDPATVLASIEPQDPRYRALQQALGGQSELIVPDHLPQIAAGVWKPGTDGAGVQALRARLAAIGFDSGPTAAPAVYDAGLSDAVQRYQERAGLSADGVAGPRTVAMLNRTSASGKADILISLERMRWLAGHDLNARHVWVNLPEFNARIMQGGQQLFDTRTVIGKSSEDYRTPEFSDEIEYMVVNPRWNIPRSITVREYLPRLQANRHAVSHLDVIDGNGNVIPRDRINFGQYTAKSFPFRMRQKPSDDNALGQVKFMFPNPWNIYLHDTPTKHLFGNASRAYSHGCIRIGRPLDLAYELLQGTSDNPEATFKRALDSGRETYLNLKQPIPVHLVYFTAFPDEAGRIRHYPDVYGRDALVLAAYERAALEKFGPDE